VSLYDLNNWVFTYGSGVTYKVVIEVTTYVQLWNPHNLPLSGALTVHYQNSDQVNLNGTSFTLTSPPDATIIFQDTDTDPVNPDPNKPVITSPLAEIGNVGVAFNYQITSANSPNQYRRIKPNEYRVVALPAPSSIQLPISRYGATGLPPGLTVKTNGGNAGLISGTPTTAGTYNVTISATNGGVTVNETFTLTIKPPPPVITSSLTATGQVGVAFSYTITATNNPTSYNATGLPAGLSVNTSTGLISGTPTTAG